MPAELMLVRCQDGSLRPATEADQEMAAAWKVGQAVRVVATQVRPRSLQHHRLYWGGLITLAMDYWTPTGGVVSASEISTLKRFCAWMEHKSGDSGAIRTACRAFLFELRGSRAQRYEAPQATKQALHEWIKMEAGYYRLEETPGGVRRVPLSINFNAMSQDEFGVFYKAAFSVVWRFILSRAFEDDNQAQNAIDQLLQFG